MFFQRSIICMFVSLDKDKSVRFFPFLNISNNTHIFRRVIKPFSSIHLSLKTLDRYLFCRIRQNDYCSHSSLCDVSNTSVHQQQRHHKKHQNILHEPSVASFETLLVMNTNHIIDILKIHGARHEIFTDSL